MPDETKIIVPGEPLPAVLETPRRGDSDQVIIARINAELERNRQSSREKIILQIIAAAATILTPIGTALGAYYLSNLGTRVEQVQTRQAENAVKIDDVHAAVGDVKRDVGDVKRQGAKKSLVPEKEQP